jgi:hypothetical protein
MLKVILHIGQSKAGSSAIQAALAAKPEILKNNNIVYPLTGRLYGDSHHGILQQIIEGDTSLLEDCLERHKDDSTIIISCEGFWLLKDDSIRVLNQALKDVDVDVLVYFREVVSYLQASWRQSIKQKGSTHTFDQHCERVKEKLDYPEVLRRWSEFFSIKVASYDRHRSDLVKKFSRDIGLEDTALSHSRISVNLTPNDGVIRVMRLVNKYFSPFVAAKFRKHLLRNQNIFSALPKYNHSFVSTYASEICSNWDLTILSKYMEPKDIDCLLSK